MSRLNQTDINTWKDYKRNVHQLSYSLHKKENIEITKRTIQIGKRGKIMIFALFAYKNGRRMIIWQIFRAEGSKGNHGSF